VVIKGKERSRRNVEERMDEDQLRGITMHFNMWLGHAQETEYFFPIGR